MIWPIRIARLLARISLCAAPLTLEAVVTPARAGVTFNFTFDSSIASDFGSNSSALAADVTAVGNTFSNLFSNNVTLTIDVTAATTSGVLGASQSNYTDLYSFSATRNTLIAHASTSASTAATLALPTTEPSPNKANTGNPFPIAISTAEEKALGLIAGTAATMDGTFYVGTAANWDFAGTSTPASNAYSFFDTAEHEISEIMGRSTQLTNAAFAYNTPIDLFRCTATGTNGAGVINMRPTATSVYFSTDGCATAAKYYNGPNSNGADIQDWATTATADPYDAYATPGVFAPLSLADQQIMNVLGWQSAIPEPMALSLVVPGLFGMTAARHRRRKASSRSGCR